MAPLCGELSVSARARKDVKSSKLRVLGEAMHKVLAPLTLASSCEFHLNFFGTHRKYHPTAISQCCDTSEEEYMLGVKHGGTHFHAFVARSGKYISILKKGMERSQAEIEVG